MIFGFLRLLKFVLKTISSFFPFLLIDSEICYHLETRVISLFKEKVGFFYCGVSCGGVIAWGRSTAGVMALICHTFLWSLSDCHNRSVFPELGIYSSILQKPRSLLGSVSITSLNFWTLTYQIILSLASKVWLPI